MVQARAVVVGSDNMHRDFESLCDEMENAKVEKKGRALFSTSCAASSEYRSMLFASSQKVSPIRPKQKLGPDIATAPATKHLSSIGLEILILCLFGGSSKRSILTLVAKSVLQMFSLLQIGRGTSID